jgi:hypothetical protein
MAFASSPLPVATSSTRLGAHPRTIPATFSRQIASKPKLKTVFTKSYRCAILAKYERTDAAWIDPLISEFATRYLPPRVREKEASAQRQREQGRMDLIPSRIKDAAGRTAT